ncbi:hypothetical protein JR316_0001461 [Psilocybe cubensis]|uniref:Uncharacterized protein n=2 Tax=Psilocybe cubensis TaxID=181762 RepID=A0ACB8HHH2_PSICU|nr:hypothetical protein JR316_0001461 [Psilocybe cubensis]KAH9487386.1 hypothetical protein JR316_0001461 [Psilocybe cubensis]
MKKFRLNVADIVAMVLIGGTVLLLFVWFVILNPLYIIFHRLCKKYIAVLRRHGRIEAPPPPLPVNTQPSPDRIAASQPRNFNIPMQSPPSHIGPTSSSGKQTNHLQPIPQSVPLPQFPSPYTRSTPAPAPKPKSNPNPNSPPAPTPPAGHTPASNLSSLPGQLDEMRGLTRQFADLMGQARTPENDAKLREIWASITQLDELSRVDAQQVAPVISSLPGPIVPRASAIDTTTTTTSRGEPPKWTLDGRD